MVARPAISATGPHLEKKSVIGRSAMNWITLGRSDGAPITCELGHTILRHLPANWGSVRDNLSSYILILIVLLIISIGLLGYELWSSS